MSIQISLENTPVSEATRRNLRTAGVRLLAEVMRTRRFGGEIHWGDLGGFCWGVVKLTTNGRATGYQCIIANNVGSTIQYQFDPAKGVSEIECNAGPTFLESVAHRIA